MKLVLLASIAAALLAAPAAAEDFTGLRVGGHVGFAGNDVVDADSALAGVSVGYDYDLGSAVFGGMAEYQRGIDSRLGDDLSLAARLGFKWQDQILFYSLAGYTRAELDEASGSRDGFRFGFGGEMMMSDNVYTRIEYRHSDYESGSIVQQWLLGFGYRF